MSHVRRLQARRLLSFAVGLLLLFLSSVSPTLSPFSAASTFTYRGGGGFNPASNGPVFQTYTVRNGDTLLGIAIRFGVDLDALMTANGLSNADRLKIGQVLRIPQANTPNAPSTTTAQSQAPAPPIPAPQPPTEVQPPHDAPGDKIISDSEAVYSPAYADFDIAAFVRQQNGFLASYSESVDGDSLSGAQVVQLVAERLSVGPRVLLTL
ncbi:MAG: LysM peptidoglycan-binding domain-containing protein, partial [Chloroflexi bacterium]|nr:LysM peptidoglycan-binding domain-containing protein [Chloroflexota bacterium]